jgi:hypothetical protein
MLMFGNQVPTFSRFEAAVEVTWPRACTIAGGIRRGHRCQQQQAAAANRFLS